MILQKLHGDICIRQKFYIVMQFASPSVLPKGIVQRVLLQALRYSYGSFV
jgi:hypothetical protein